MSYGSIFVTQKYGIDIKESTPTPILCRRKLVVVQLGVDALPVYQFIMSALFGYLAVVDHHNSVSIAHRIETMCNYKSGTAFHEPTHGFLDVNLCPGIHIAGGLIENQDRRIR